MTKDGQPFRWFWACTTPSNAAESCLNALDTFTPKEWVDNVGLDKEQAELVWGSFHPGEDVPETADSDLPAEALVPGSVANNDFPDECHFLEIADKVACAGIFLNTLPQDEKDAALALSPEELQLDSMKQNGDQLDAGEACELWSWMHEGEPCPTMLPPDEVGGDDGDTSGGSDGSIAALIVILVLCCCSIIIAIVAFLIWKKKQGGSEEGAWGGEGGEEEELMGDYVDMEAEDVPADGEVPAEGEEVPAEGAEAPAEGDAGVEAVAEGTTADDTAGADLENPGGHWEGDEWIWDEPQPKE